MRNDDRKVWVKGGSGARAARMLDPVARARGFATTALLTEWPAVVGEELARFTMPDKVAWPRRSEEREASGSQSAWREDGAILVLKVDGPRAIEVQHRAEQILERVNIYFGYRTVAQLRFLQAPVTNAKSKQGPKPAPGSVEEPSFAAGVADTGLAKALGRLAAGIRSKTPGP